MLVLAMQFSRDVRTPGHEDRVSECRGPPGASWAVPACGVLRPCSLKTKERT